MARADRIEGNVPVGGAGNAGMSRAASRIEARALKAANKPTRASKNPDIQMTKRLADQNKKIFKQKEPDAVRNAASLVDQIKANRAQIKANQATNKQNRIGGHAN